MTDKTGPIGVFDSGVGGLSILKEIRRELPNEDLLYVADTAHVPYGDKSVEYVERRSAAIAEFLVGSGAKAVVVACNTATAAAIPSLRSRFSLPIIGIEPAVKPAAEMTRSGVVGILATSGTLASERFSALRSRFGSQIEVIVQPCAGLVEQVERAELESLATRMLLEKHLANLLDRGADVIVLGCTHYPFLSPLIREIAGPAVSLVDPSAAVAREVRRRLEREGMLSAALRAGAERFCVSGSVADGAQVISRLWAGGDIEIGLMPSVKSGADMPAAAG